MPFRPTLLLVLCLLASGAPARAADVQMRYELIQQDLQRHTVVVRVSFELDPSPECAPAQSCDVRNAIAVQVSPCPSNAPTCTGSQGLWFLESSSEAEIGAMVLVLDTRQEYAMVGEWDLRRYSMGASGCDVLECSVLELLDRPIFPKQLAVATNEGWGAIKARFQ